MCFCNTNAQKCETSVKKLIAQKKQSTLCHRCHRGVSCSKIYLLHQSFVVCMSSTSGSTWILVSEKKNTRLALLEGTRELPCIKSYLPGFMRKLVDFEITTELVEGLCLLHPEKVPHLHLNSFASVWSYFSNISSLLNISSIQNSRVFFSETKCLQSILCHNICV